MPPQIHERWRVNIPRSEYAHMEDTKHTASGSAVEEFTTETKSPQWSSISLHRCIISSYDIIVNFFLNTHKDFTKPWWCISWGQPVIYILPDKLNNKPIIWQNLFWNSVAPPCEINCDPICRHKTKSTSVRTIACRLFGSKPNNLRWNFNWYSTFTLNRNIWDGPQIPCMLWGRYL